MAQKSRKTHDLVVKTGEYVRDGETKNRTENIGALMQDDEGRPFVMLKRTFNPAGVPNPDNRDSVLVSCYAPNNERREGGQQQTQQPAPASGGGAPVDDDSEIPF